MKLTLLPSSDIRAVYFMLGRERMAMVTERGFVRDIARVGNLMAGLNAQRVAPWVFYGFVGGWVIALAIGALFKLPYVRREYGGVTLPLYLALWLVASALCNSLSGEIWRAGHQPIERDRQPTFYWAAIAVQVTVAAVLSFVGVRNWLQLP